MVLRLCALSSLRAVYAAAIFVTPLTCLAAAAERPAQDADAPSLAAAAIAAPAYAPPGAGGSASAAVVTGGVATAPSTASTAVTAGSVAAAPSAANSAVNSGSAAMASSIASSAVSAMVTATAAAQLMHPPGPPRGALLSGPALVPIDVVTTTIEKLEPPLLRTLLNRREGLLKVTGEPRCAIAIHSIRYQTVGGQGEPTDAGAVIMAPSGTDPVCNGPRPVVLYAHGTVLDKTFSMARLSGEARLVAAIFVAQGYIVVAPDYAGYGVSSLPYHPYLNAEQQSADMVDALRAARAAYGVLGLQTSQKLFLTGYSQGGFVALATQRAIERLQTGEFQVTAAAGLSGPYALAQMADDIFGGRPSTGVTAVLPLLTTSGQRSGAALYASPEDLYETRYANGIESLLPGKVKLDDLVSKGKLPAGSALFARDSQPQAADASAFFADRNLVRTSYRNGYLQDMAAHPCQRDPAEPLDCAPENSLRKWMVKNDLRNYVPHSPLMLCGGARDPAVPFANAESAAAYFTAHGAKPVLVDMEATLPDDPYLAAKQGFAHERQVLAGDAAKKGNDPGKAVSDRYHSRLVSTFCLMAARHFFDSARP